MNKINYLLFHSFERKWFISNNRIRELDTHLTRLILNLNKNKNFRENFKTKFMFLTTEKDKKLKHKQKINLELFHVNLFKKFIPLEISFSLIKKIFKIRKNEKKIWHLNSYYYLMFDLITPILKLKKQKIIANHRGGGFTLKALPYSIFQYILVLPLMLRLTDKIIVQNKTEYLRLIKLYKINKDKIILIPNGVDLSIFKNRNKIECRKKLSLDKHKFTLLWIGRIEKNKGAKNIVPLLKELKTKINFKTIIIGNGPYKPKLTKELRENKLYNSVRLEDYMDEDSLIDYLSSSDILLHLNTKSEGSPNIILEAQSCNLPVVGFNIPGVKDSIKNDETGYIIKNKDIKQYSNKIIELYKNRKKLERMSERCRKNIIKNFDIKKITNKYLQVYNKLK